MFEEPLAFSPDQFTGIARVFPLPNLVMFPHVMQALHIFEQRYRAMLEEAVEDDRLIALGVHAPGWQTDYEGSPPIRPMACLCRVATHQRTPEGTYNVLMLGVRRIHLLEEVQAGKPFRTFAAELIEDEAPDDSDVATDLQRKLLAAFKQSMPKLPPSYDQLDQLLGSQITLGMLADIVSYTVDLSLDWKMRLLTECDVCRRAQLLLEALAGRPAAQPRRVFPPDFSEN